MAPLAGNFKGGIAVTNRVSRMIGREAVLLEAVLLEAVLLDTGSEETVDLEESILFFLCAKWLGSLDTRGV